MYQAKPITENIKIEGNALKYEDDNCVILYNFWGENGDIGFVIYNKNDENLYLHLDECFFVENGFAYDYYQNRIYTNNSTSNSSSAIYIPINNYFAVSGSDSKSVTNSVSVVEKSIISVPSQDSKKISEFTIIKQVYRDCDIFLYPRKNENNTLYFTEENSPYIFGNKLAYSIGDTDTINRIKNIFYVSKISNYSIEEITKLVEKEHCGKKLGVKERVLIESGPDQFYIKYNWDTYNDNLKH
ncbi:MAG: hypothetical protein IKU05_06035 [Bacteroidales bacterium]|nr:hypothetical protein [Bacteroidales bacterium]